MATSQSYRDILSGMADSLKPGGEIDKAMMADIDTQGKQLGAQLGGSAVGRGFGNAQLSAPTEVFKHVSKMKQSARSDLLERYMNVMGNLAQMAQTEEQGAANRGLQQFGMTTAKGMTPQGTPIPGSMLSTEQQATQQNTETQGPLVKAQLGALGAQTAQSGAQTGLINAQTAQSGAQTSLLNARAGLLPSLAGAAGATSGGFNNNLTGGAAEGDDTGMEDLGPMFGSDEWLQQNLSDLMGS